MMKAYKIFVFLLLSSLAYSQGAKYGIMANFHKGSIVNVHDVSKGRFGGSMGVFAEWPLVENDIFDSAWLYIVPQMEYSMQGEIAKAEESQFGKQKFEHNYAAVQVFIKYFMHKGNMKRDIYFFGGPRAEFLLSENRQVSNAYDAAYYKYNLDNELNKIGLGLSIGTGLKVSQSFEAFVRFDRGFTKVYPNNPKHTYNRALAVGLNYYLKKNWW